VLKFYNGVTQKFDNLSQGKTGTFQGTGSNSGKRIVTIWVKSGNNSSGNGPGYGEKFDFYDTATIKRGLGLDNVPYPYPSGSWDNYIDYARDSNGSTSWYSWNIYNAGYRRKFGMLTLINFWLEKKKRYSQTPALWSTRHYPFRALSDSTTLFTQFLTGLQFGDYLGLVSYATTPRVHYSLTADPQWNVPGVSLGSNPITNNYNAIATIQQHKQAAHYTNTTNIGGGINTGINTLNTYGRYGARPTILLMTDGKSTCRVARPSRRCRLS